MFKLIIFVFVILFSCVIEAIPIESSNTDENATSNNKIFYLINRAIENDNIEYSKSHSRHVRQLDIPVPVPSPTLDTLTVNCLRNCPATSEYNPVCGDDGIQYSNPGRLSCAVYCTQTAIKIRYFGSCDPSVRTS